MKAITICIDAEPVAQGRGKAFVRRDGRAGIYDPVKSRNWKELVRTAATAQASRDDWDVYHGAVEMFIYTHIPIPKSWSSVKKERAKRGDVAPISRPDVSNYAKGIEDALNGVIYQDDSQITKLTVSKEYSDKPGVIVRVEKMGIVL